MRTSRARALISGSREYTKEKGKKSTPRGRGQLQSEALLVLHRGQAPQNPTQGPSCVPGERDPNPPGRATFLVFFCGAFSFSLKEFCSRKNQPKGPCNIFPPWISILFFLNAICQYHLFLKGNHPGLITWWIYNLFFHLHFFSLRDNHFEYLVNCRCNPHGGFRRSVCGFL